MPYFVDDPKHWRDRAEEARVLAELIADPKSRQQMVAVAEAYERMASRADGRGATSDRPG
jgi:hypothetical protein